MGNAEYMGIKRFFKDMPKIIYFPVQGRA